uniref:Uncharacterized protein n=2 Tax=Helianthus annuus TaxID=4232 RepID=A0A251U3G5_HELAN
MTESDKFKFLGCAFLDFQGTTMCHKLLVTDPPSTKPGTSKGNRCRNILDLDRVNDVFEESQASKPRESVSGGFLKCYHRRKFVSLTRLSNSECKNM